jgi:hypothetical protein
MTLAVLKEVIVSAIKDTSAFADNQEHVYPFRPLEPGHMSSHVASKLKGLAAFVSIERLTKGDEDRDPAKRLSIVTDLWINPWGEKVNVTERDSDFLTLSDGSPVVAQLRDVEDVVAEIIVKLDDLIFETFPSGETRFKYAFQDAFRLSEVPKPFFVYRVIGQSLSVLT